MACHAVPLWRQSLLFTFVFNVARFGHPALRLNTDRPNIISFFSRVAVFDVSCCYTLHKSVFCISRNCSSNSCPLIEMSDAKMPQHTWSVCLVMMCKCVCNDAVAVCKAMRFMNFKKLSAFCSLKCLSHT